jgi:N-acetyl-1-D-myo-inositol-2-amino-2-deoxy-alpha-D-glucopyranoside deacetylase
VGRVSAQDPTELPSSSSPTAPPTQDRRILFVHAHPDDETISTGATMAYYAATGAHVTLVTCTLGEEGEIHVPALAGLAADQADQLGGYRLVELERACQALGVTDHRFLGGAGRYRDSGMMGTPANDHPRAFWRADLDEAANHLVEVMREVRPQVLVTYDPNGGYGHPDHINAHRVAMLAAQKAGEFAPAKIYWTAVPRSVLAAGLEQFAGSTDNPFADVTTVDDVPFAVPDERIAARIDGSRYAEAKMAAVRAHATQIPPGSWLYTLAGGFGKQFLGVEYYELVHGQRGPGGPDGLETDLFAGLT